MRGRILWLMLAFTASTTGCASWPFDLFSDYYSAGDNTYEGKKQHYEAQAAKWGEGNR